MNIVSQIIIISSHQSVAEIPGALFESLIVHLESKYFHVFNHKNSCNSGVAFTEWINLPNIWSKLGKILHTTFHRQACVRELFFRYKITIKSVLNAVPRCVGDSITFQHPFLFRNIFCRIWPAWVNTPSNSLRWISSHSASEIWNIFSPNSFAILADTISASLVPFSVSMRSAFAHNSSKRVSMSHQYWFPLQYVPWRYLTDRQKFSSHLLPANRLQSVMRYDSSHIALSSHSSTINW